MTMSESEILELHWEYPQTPQSPYALRGAGSEVAHLWFAEEPWAASYAEMEGRRLSFTHTAGRHMRIEIGEGEPAQPVAEFVRDFGGGVVTLASGAKYCWRKSGLRPGRWCFRREGDRSSVCVSQLAGPVVKGATVMVCPGAAALPETSILVLLAWYLRILDFQAEIDRMYTAF